MAEKQLDCIIISPDRLLNLKAARLMSDAQRGLNLIAQHTSPVVEINKAQAEEMRASGAQVILLDLGDDPAVGLRLARFLVEDHPGIALLLTGPTIAPEVLLEAMRIGATEYLARPVDDAELGAALARATRRIRGSETRDGMALGQVICLYSPKGGTGVTTTAANLGVQIAHSTRKRTLLVDLDLQMGGTALVLGLRPRYSVLEVVRNLHRMDRDLLESFVETHETGLTVLASPVDPRPGDEGPTRDQIRAVIQFLRRQFDWIILDVGHVFTPVTMAALEAADRVVLITTPDVVSLNHSKRALPIVERAVGGANSIHVVVNRRQGTDVITSGDVRKALGHEVYTTLANDEAHVPESVNTGKPVVAQRKSKFAKDVRSLADLLVAVPAVNGNGRHGPAAIKRIWPFGPKQES
ncbi:MAG: AAA family ATPase [Longimicrobiales bacterium]